MRLTDVIERDVIDQTGRSWGQVHDLHLVQDGPIAGEGDAAFRLHGLVVGRGSFGTQLGYAGHANKTRGPWVIKTLVRWFHRHAVYIPWQHVVAVEDARILVESPAGGFDRPREIGDV